MAPPKIQQIAELNDAFRGGDPSVPGQRYVTAGIIHLFDQLDIPAETLIQRAAQFDDFNDDNAPHAEHDFGAFEFHGINCFGSWIAMITTTTWARTIPRTSARHAGC